MDERYIIPDQAFQDKITDSFIEEPNSFVFKNKRTKSVQNATKKKYLETAKDPVKRREAANAIADGKWWDIKTNTWQEDEYSANIKAEMQQKVKDEWSKTQVKENTDKATNIVNNKKEPPKKEMQKGTEDANEFQKNSQSSRTETQDELLTNSIKPRAWYWQYAKDMVADMDPDKQSSAAKSLYAKHLLATLANMLYRTGDAGSIMAGQTPLNNKATSDLSVYAQQKMKDFLSQVDKVDARKIDSKIERDKQYQEFLQSQEFKALDSSFYDINKKYQENQADLKIDQLKYVGQQMGKEKLKLLENSLNNALLYSNNPSEIFQTVLGSLGAEAVNRVTDEFNKNKNNGLSNRAAIGATLKALF